MQTYAKKLSEIKDSPTIAISQKAKILREQGIDVISLSVGEPDFTTPDNIKQAAIKAIEQNHTRYTPVNGIIELRKAIVNKLQRENGLKYTQKQIAVGCGGKQVIFNALLATLDEGDEVIIPSPYWVSYPDIVRLANGTPIIVDCENQDTGLKLRPDQLESAITKKTKWLILNSPNNPSGAVYSKTELQSIAKILLRHPNIHIISDDIYEHILFDHTTFHNIAKIEPKLFERVFIANGVSKAYAMTGWRLGYGAGNTELIKKINKIQSQTTYHTSSISQYAATEALNGPQDYLQRNSQILQERRDIAIKILCEHTELTCEKPHGTFYAYFNCQKYIGNTLAKGKQIDTDVDFANLLLEIANVAVVPGAAFGKSPYFRLSFAIDNKLLIKACDRIENLCNNLRK